MALAAAQVIDALAALITGLPLTGSRVYTSRLHPVTEADLPCWRVVAETEAVTQSMLIGTNEHLLSVAVVGLVRATADVDDSMHALAAQGLAALWPATPLYGLQLDSISRDVVGDGEASMGAITVRATARYHVVPQAPETIL